MKCYSCSKETKGILKSHIEMDPNPRNHIKDVNIIVTNRFCTECGHVIDVDVPGSMQNE